MASTQIELGDVGQSSQHATDHRQSLLSTSPNRDTPPNSTIEPQHRGWSSRGRSLPWKLEIFTWIISLCFFIAIVVALIVFDGNALPNLPLGINPNAILQVLATFGQAFLMVPVTSALGQLKWLRALQVRPVDDFRAMDEASRGAWGGVMLLVRRKGGFIASLGACITIIALAIGTFVQQTLKYETNYPSSNDAFIPTAKYMNGSGTAQFSNQGLATQGIDPEVLSASFVGLFSPLNTTYIANAHCSTGNCTWDSYQTLAVCNTCVNLASQLNRTKVLINVREDNSYYTDYYILPNGALLNGIQPTSANGSLTISLLNITTTHDFVHPAPPLALGEAEVVATLPSVAFPDKATGNFALLSAFAIGVAPGTFPDQPDEDTSDGPFTGEGYSTPAAFECLLQLCVHELRADFHNGTLIETIVSTYTEDTNIGNFVLRPPGSDQTFIPSPGAISVTGNWLSDLITGNVSASLNYKRIDTSLTIASKEEIQLFFAAMNTSDTGFPDMMDNIARSLSLGLRTIPNQPQAPGLAFSPVTRATIYWPWLALPFSLLAASLVFLIVVMIETKRKNLVPWTNSVLAALFHGIDQRSSDHEFRETRATMEDEARTLLVEFQPQVDGGRLVAVKPS